MFKKALNIFVFFILISTSVFVYANTNVVLSTENSNSTLEDNVVIVLDIETTSTGQVELSEINGINNFTRIGQSSTNQISIVNGEKFSKYQLKLTLKPKKTGKLKIGPIDVILGDDNISSNSIEINISNSKKISKNNDIKPIKNPNDPYFSFFFFQAVVLLLLLGLYFYLRFSKKDDKTLEQKQEIKTEKKDHKKELINKITHLLNSADIMNKSEFYENLNFCFRDYFKMLGFEKTETLTLKELKKLDFDKKVILLYEKSYISEFSDKKDTPKTRKAIVNDFLEIIK